jgi:hypothetical protein
LSEVTLSDNPKPLRSFMETAANSKVVIESGALTAIEASPISGSVVFPMILKILRLCIHIYTTFLNKLVKSVCESAMFASGISENMNRLKHELILVYILTNLYAR